MLVCLFRISLDVIFLIIYFNNRYINLDDIYLIIYFKGSYINGIIMREMYGREYVLDVVSYVFYVLFVGLKINIVIDVVKRDILDLFVKNIWLI